LDESVKERREKKKKEEGEERDALEMRGGEEKKKKKRKEDEKREMLTSFTRPRIAMGREIEQHLGEKREKAAYKTDQDSTLQLSSFIGKKRKKRGRP